MTRSLPTALASGAAVAAAAWSAPALASVGPLRRRFAPRLSGTSTGRHVTLSFDDGPDATSTPLFLDLLRRHDVRATFFLLGAHVEDHAELVRRMADDGHELAVHGWDHRCTAVVGPARLTRELRATTAVITDLTGRAPVHYRPPYGVPSASAVVAARHAGLDTVLWSAWGRDWERRATPESIVRTVGTTLRPGGTVLLHDSDRTSAPGSWRGTLQAMELLLDRWAAEGLSVRGLAKTTAR